jgi:hypothetical protein
MHLVPPHNLQRLGAVGRLQRLKAMLSKHSRYGLAKVAIVIGNQEARRYKMHGEHTLGSRDQALSLDASPMPLGALPSE